MNGRRAGILATTQSILTRSGPLGVVFSLFVVLLAGLTLSRAVLVVLHWPRLEGVEGLWRVFPIGLRMDTIILCWLFALPVTLYFLLPDGSLRRRVTAVAFTAVVALLANMELSTPSFIAQYDTRPNRLYFEYLRYPTEVFGTLFKTYPVQLALVVLALGLLCVASYRFCSRRMARAQDWSWGARAACLPLVIALLFVGARSSFGHRPANMSTASFSENHLANELAVSSTYAVLNAAYMTLNEPDTQIYGEMGWAEAKSRVEGYSNVGLQPQSSAATASNAAPRRPRNLVIVVMESLGAGYVGSLGGLPLTPNLDRLSSEGLWFTQLYATGTRTVRGLEAIVSGFPPTRAQSVLKRTESQRDFFTLATLLRQLGYRTDFVYGGVSNFDNMGRFFRQNGFERVIEQKDFESPVFEGTWGVSDEDLVAKAHETFLEHGDEPFFAVLLTTSNHEPFEYPEGRIEPYEEPLFTRHNAVKYTDFAVGRLIELARAAPYGKDTLFLIVADHDARVFGADLVPIERFHVPGLVLGPDVPRRREDRIVSQIDLAPTLLGLMGISVPNPMIGRNLLTLPADRPGRAMMQYMDVNAFRVGDEVVIHEPYEPAKAFNYLGGRLVPCERDPELERDALAHLSWAETTYRERRYRFTGVAALVKPVSKSLAVTAVRQ